MSNEVRTPLEKIRRSEKCGVKYMQRWEEIAYARQEGALRENIAAICKKLAKGKSVEQIADELEQEPEKISQICCIAEKYAPAYSPDAIWRELAGGVSIF